MALQEICGWNDEYEYVSLDREIIEHFYTMSSNFTQPTKLLIPPVHNLCKYFPQGSIRCISDEFEHGTTTLGFQFRGGIILCVDSRGTSGKFISSQAMEKVVKINDYMLATIAGGAADCVYWNRVLTVQGRLHELRNLHRITVAAASKLMIQMFRPYRNNGLSMGMMLAGWDATRGPSLYYIDSNCMRVKGDCFSVGSGSFYAITVLDTGFRWNLTDEEAYDLARRSIYHATFRDSFSGGTIRVFHIKPTGWVHISNDDCMDLHYKYKMDAVCKETTGSGDSLEGEIG